MSTGLTIVLSTFPDKHEAERVSRLVVDGGLALCAQIGAELVSFYRWEGEVKREHEVAVSFKVLDARLDLFLGELNMQHPYDVPQILGLPVAVVGDQYLAWARGGHK